MAIKQEQAAQRPEVAQASAVVATSIHEAEEFLALVDSFPPIASNEEYESAGLELVKVKTAIRDLKTKHSSIKRPILEAGRAVDDLFKRPIEFWEKVEEKIKRMLADWRAVQQAKRDEEERLRQQELARISKRIEKAEEKGDETKVSLLQSQAGAVAAAPGLVEKPVASGISGAMKWKYKVIDPKMILAAALDGQVTWNLKSPGLGETYTGAVTISIEVGKLVSAQERDCKIPGIVVFEEEDIRARAVR